jgi:hypothetical protein
MNHKQVTNIISAHGFLLPNGQFQLHKPMKVFKKVYSTDHNNRVTAKAIANLILPVGAIINPPQGNSNKCRASEAFCWSIVEIKKHTQLTMASSGHTANFKYRSARALGMDIKTLFTVNPRTINAYPIHIASMLHQVMCKPDAFSYHRRECDPGIHFFVEHTDAIAW